MVRPIGREWFRKISCTGTGSAGIFARVWQSWMPELAGKDAGAPSHGTPVPGANCERFLIVDSLPSGPAAENAHSGRLSFCTRALKRGVLRSESKRGSTLIQAM